MKRKQKSNYNFSEAMKNADVGTPKTQQLEPDAFLSHNPAPKITETYTNNQQAKKINIETPFLDNLDAEFQEPDFKGGNKKSADPFDDFSAPSNKFDNPFNNFNNEPVKCAPESVNVLEHVLTSGFLSAKDTGARTAKTPFD